MATAALLPACQSSSGEPLSDPYCTINIASMHHIYESIWLKDDRYVNGYIDYLLQPGGNNRGYSGNVADAAYYPEACFCNDQPADDTILKKNQKKESNFIETKTMHKLIQPGRIIFAIGIAALGILQFLVKDFIIARPPAPIWATDITGKHAWAYISGLLLVIFAIAIVLKIKARAAAISMAILIFIGSFLTRNLPDMASVTKVENLLWKVNAWKTLGLCGGALIVAASFSRQKKYLLTAGYIALAVFLIICGLAHFKFADFTKTLIPAYIGNGLFWTYFSAIALLAGGIGIIFSPTRKYAGLLAGVMIFLWFVLLHIPRAIQLPPLSSVPIYGEWMGVFESFAFSGAFFALSGQSSKLSTT